MDWLFFFLVFMLIYCFLMYFQMKAKKAKEYNPFKLWEMTTALKCKKCNWKKLSTFERGDYVFKVITDSRQEHNNCDGEVEIIGIFFEHKETPEEKRWKEYERRFR